MAVPAGLARLWCPWPARRHRTLPQVPAHGGCPRACRPLGPGSRQAGLQPSVSGSML